MTLKSLLQTVTCHGVTNFKSVLTFFSTGTLEIVASCSNQGSGTLNAYIMPENWMEEPWTKVVIGSDFVPRGTGQNLMSPGKSMVFYPSK